MHSTPIYSAPPTSTLPPAMLHLLHQRSGVSPLEQASHTLAHALEYLVQEQLAGRCTSLAANREAIAILSLAGEHLYETERRRPAKLSIAAWLRGASLSRALQDHDDDLPDF